MLFQTRGSSSLSLVLGSDGSSKSPGSCFVLVLRRHTWLVYCYLGTTIHSHNFQRFQSLRVETPRGNMATVISIDYPISQAHLFDGRQFVSRGLIIFGAVFTLPGRHVSDLEPPAKDTSQQVTSPIFTAQKYELKFDLLTLFLLICKRAAEC